jgi:hypothetical protein
VLIQSFVLLHVPFLDFSYATSPTWLMVQLRQMGVLIPSVSNIATSFITRLHHGKQSILAVGVGTSKIHSSPNEPPLCRICRQLDFTTQKDNEDITIQLSSAKHILKSASKGCPLCVFLLALISRAGLETKFSGIRLRYSGRLLSGFSVLIDVPDGHFSISIETYITQGMISDKF